MKKNLVCLLVFLVGCIGGSLAPPSSFEVKILSQTAMAIGIHSQDMTLTQIEALLVILEDVRGVIQLAIAEDPSTVEPITLGIAGKLDPVYAAAMKGMLQLMILRIRPYLQEGGDLNLAAEYIDAVFDGSILACAQALPKKEAA